MKPEDQRIAIAKACGWDWVSWGKNQIRLLPPNNYHGKKCSFSNPDRIVMDLGKMTMDEWILDTLSMFHDYLNDLNAMHEAEKVLISDEDKNLRWYPYCKLISKMVNGLNEHAEASHKAEAFLKTINRWTE